ncbi:MAG: CDP-alcohol phosphatidyltransferase [Bacteroidales bacterium]|nr:CDP-alcohol phosphatidyltransferase [Bacteroidales bacterium]
MADDNKVFKKAPKTSEVYNAVFGDRTRTNLLKKYEQQAIAWLVQRMPQWVTSNFLTGVGFSGYIIVFASFVLATYFSRAFLLVGLPGFVINWFGDSLDGRLAYYRKKPRKQYGFTLDITIDWLSIILIGLGYIIYAEGVWEVFGYGFVAMYAWEIILALIRYRITGNYSIDSGKFGPTELRIMVGAAMVAEVIQPGSIIFSAGFLVIAIFIVNIIDTRKLLRVADEIDKKEAQSKS